MTVQPIIFSAPMVRALIEGRKTQTRRLAQTPGGRNAPWINTEPGDLLYVRETFSGGFDYINHYVSLYETAEDAPHWWPKITPICYWADGEPSEGDWGKRRPAIHMPRWASRLTLEVTAVRLQKLHYITEGDAIAEGIYGEGRNWTAGGGCDGTDPIAAFQALWWKIHGIGSWTANPAVVAISFAVHKQNVDSPNALLE